MLSFHLFRIPTNNDPFNAVHINWYFAYGSNMNPERMRARGLAFAEAESGHLHRFGLYFNKRASGKDGVGYANIGHCGNARVEGVLYQLVDPREISIMDGFEGCPVRYSREVMRIHRPRFEDEVDAWVYVANPAFIESSLLPERRYLNHLMAGARWHSEAYQVTLRQQSCIEQMSADKGAGGLAYND